MSPYKFYFFIFILKKFLIVLAASSRARDQTHDLSHCSDNAGFLIHWTTRELHLFINFRNVLQDLWAEASLPIRKLEKLKGKRSVCKPDKYQTGTQLLCSFSVVSGVSVLMSPVQGNSQCVEGVEMSACCYWRCAQGGCVIRILKSAESTSALGYRDKEPPSTLSPRFPLLLMALHFSWSSLIPISDFCWILILCLYFYTVSVSAQMRVNGSFSLSIFLPYFSCIDCVIALRGDLSWESQCQ